MAVGQTPLLSVSDFIALTNQTLEYAYPSVEIEGEVASFKINQGKYVFFDLRDESGTIGCFMMVYQLRVPIEDGMKVIVQASPKLTQWGRFSLTVRQIRPSGEGAIKKSFELLRRKLEAEGLFAPERKRTLPVNPRRLAVISSTQAAGYGDFIKILDDRWGGVHIEVAHVQVQGARAPEQIIAALKYFNEQEELADVIAVVRGGGSADDLAVFNDEPLVRAIAGSRIPVITGVGHEVDETLADFAADVRAATPSNAAQLLVPDRVEYLRTIHQQLDNLTRVMQRRLDELSHDLHLMLWGAYETLEHQYTEAERTLEGLRGALRQLDPGVVLGRGYAIVRGEATVGAQIHIETRKAIITAERQSYDKK